MSVLRNGIETRTGFGDLREVPVALNLGGRVLSPPFVQDLTERIFLALRAIVNALACAVHATNVADVQGCAVKASDSIADLFIRSERHHLATGLDDLVVAG